MFSERLILQGLRQIGILLIGASVVGWFLEDKSFVYAFGALLLGTWLWLLGCTDTEND